MMELVFKPKIGAVRLQKKRRVNPSGYLDDTYLRLDGKYPMTGDWLVLPDVALKSVANYLQVWNAAKTYLRHIRCDMLNPNSIQMYPPTGIKIQIDSYCNLETYQSATSYWNLRSYTGSAFQTAIKLIGGSAELPFAKLTGSLLNPDQFIEVGGPSIPAASEAYRGMLAMMRKGSGDEDIVMICCKNADDSYDWIEVCRGTP